MHFGIPNWDIPLSFSARQGVGDFDGEGVGGEEFVDAGLHIGPMPESFIRIGFR
jgi:hypothetical protein